MRIDVSLLPVLAATFMLVFARVGSMVMLLPGLGESNIPVRIKLGIASTDYPWYRAASGVFKAELARIGGPPVAAEFYGCNGCSSESSYASACLSEMKPQ